MREFEIKKDNVIMASKISKIFSVKSQNEPKSYSLNKNIKVLSEKEKWKIFKITQDNQLLLKRLHEAQTSYNHKKYDDEYKKSLYYKSNICEFNVGLPKITLRQLEDKNFSLTQTKGFNLTSGMSMSKQGKTHDNFYSNKSEEPMQAKNQTILFYRSCFFQDLFYCQFKFYLENKKFIIFIQPKEIKHITFYIIIEDIKEILKLKCLYTNYEDIIDHLDHNLSFDLVFIKNSKLKISYFTIKVDHSKLSSELNTIEEVLNSFKAHESDGRHINEEQHSDNQVSQKNDNSSIN